MSGLRGDRPSNHTAVDDHAIHDVIDGQPLHRGRKGWLPRRAIVIESLLAASQSADGDVLAHLDAFLDVDAPVWTLSGLPCVERAEGVEIRGETLPIITGAAVVRRHHLVDGGDVVLVHHAPDVVPDKRSQIAVSHHPSLHRE